MEIRFVPPDLRRFDLLKSEAMALGFFADERPLRGALGLVDWRLCGFLSRQLMAGRARGERGEVLLVPARGRLALEKVFVFGLGRRDDFDPPALDAVLQRMFAVLGGAQIRSSVLAIPGRAVGLVAPEAGMKALLRAAEQRPETDEVTLVEPPEAQKAMEKLIEQERRRARARLGPAEA